MRVWVTGATGFVGRALVARLLSEGVRVMPVSRTASSVSGLKARTPNAMLEGLAKDDVIVYAAGLAHLPEPSGESQHRALWRANCEEPCEIARQAAKKGVRRFVFVSSVKVQGERTAGRAFTEQDEPDPRGAYAQSKWAGEQGLRAIAGETGLELVIVRPPLVYGSGVKANFALMMRWLKRGVPLPLASIRNRRSLIFLDNLVAFLWLCCQHPAAAGETLLVSDGVDLSTPELLRALAAAQGGKVRIWPCPPSLLRLGAALLGKRTMAGRLCDSLQLDDDKARRLLGWKPPVSMAEGLKITVTGRAG
mgnify:CR=1 FL=1